MSFMMWMFHHPKVSTILDTVRDDNRGTFYQRLYSLMKNARIRLTLQMASYRHVVMQKRLWSTFICKLYLRCIFFVIQYKSCYVFSLIFSKDIYYYCVIHVSGQGLFSEANGGPKGGNQIKLPFPDSMQEKMLELRRDFWLHNDTQMMIMLSICMKK